MSKFESLTGAIDFAFEGVEPCASRMIRYSIYRVDDYNGVDVKDDNIWYSSTLIAIADICD